MNKSKECTVPDGHGVDGEGCHDLAPGVCQKPAVQAPQDLFNQETGDVDFCGVSWQGAAILITKFQIGLGALSLPSTFHILGFFPGIICFIVLALITTVAGYMCGNARQYYPHMHSIGDAAELLFGKGARELVGAIYYVYLALVAGAGMLATSVALNTLSDHGACSMIFVAVTSASALLLGTGFRSLEKVSWLSWIGVAGIIIAIWITAIACLTQNRPAAAPSTSPINLDIRVFPNASFSEAMAAISSQLFTLGASGTFFSVSAEMKSPELFTRSLIRGQSFIVITNIAISSIMYAKVGQYLASPALGSAGPFIKKISYGIALPGLVVTAVLWSHVAAKYWFVRILRGTPHLQSNTVVHWSVWVGSMVITVIFGFVIVGVVPFFDNFLSLVGALVNPVFTNIVPGFMLLYFLAKRPTRAVDGVQHIDTERSVSVRKWLLEAFKAYRNGWKEVMVLTLACFMILTGALIIVGGTYATVLVIKASYDEGRVSGVFSCADSS
ncbi:transmembrane amino acid transporter protein-domain-containing protein [Aspergillus pseudotamarii]|uniref:Transmembrane amino acid transporter protein-domain-containing protein n=1 Tax=Aspergillus pseudotamarii TaxID=132259 RepID=A0A5N6SN04_ASPPS|nr:transmembrane amino acid transporter protein-domain-containing protein [Aspergillus pseudotamarii]KAE8135091.1 transmembrane amino acid transporter protein-domain-containing protein [Aspergillus pseudotamarii]